MNALQTNADAGHFVAWLDAEAGLPAARCYVKDVSRAGAKVRVFRPQVPSEFTLHFTREGDAKVRCRVTARAGSNVDVEFVSSLSIYS
jgi:hypothetical protein